MRILLIGFGSRGDVQPLVALGKGLRQAGYEVAIAAGINFQQWIESEGFGFEPFHVDVEAYMQTDLGKEWLGESSHNPRVELQNMKRMADLIAEPVADDLLRMVDTADVFIDGLITIEPIATLTRVRGKQHILGMLSPLAPTRSGAAGMQSLLPRSEIFINRWWGYFIESMLFKVMEGPSNSLRKRLNLSPATRSEFLRAANQTPTLLGISPLVTPPPADWGNHIHVTGYWFANGNADWQPSPALKTFLDAGDPPVYIGFGSMSTRDPQGTTQLMIEALKKSKQRGVIHSGWAGLHAEDLPPEIFLLDYAPHEWLFPRMKAVVHHGGAGTTGAALRAGVPSAIVAHMGDQPYWGRRVHELGAGAPFVRRHELTVDRLADTIRFITTDTTVQKNAAAVGERIRSEDGIGNAVRAIGQILDKG
ncbi:MAG: glycosyltransferase [Anaerolineae bacterium]|nr:glycosyltransferase [Anaerolineae bacterium]